MVLSHLGKEKRRENKYEKKGKQICQRRVDDNFLNLFRPSFFVCSLAAPLFLYFQSISWQHYRCKQQRSSNMFALSRPPAAHLSFINLFLQYNKSICSFSFKVFFIISKVFFLLLFPKYIFSKFEFELNRLCWIFRSHAFAKYSNLCTHHFPRKYFQA